MRWPVPDLVRRTRDAATRWIPPREPEALPVRFDRKRIYVLPTRFGMFFTAVLAAMLLGALNYNNNPALMLGLLLGGAALTSLFAAHLQLSGLAVVAMDADPVPAGTPVRLRVHARAEPGRSRRGLRLQCAGIETWMTLRDGVGEATLELPTERRGWLDLTRLRIDTTRPLGLAVAWAYVWPRAEVLVYPSPEPHAPPLPEDSGDQTAARVHPSGEDVHHLRPYRRGDARRAIAWKPSARRDELMVREFERPVGGDLELDWRAVATLPWEARIRRLARWVDDAERAGRRWRLVLPGQPPLGPALGPAHRHACLKALALMPEGPHG